MKIAFWIVAPIFWLAGFFGTAVLLKALGLGDFIFIGCFLTGIAASVFWYWVYSLVKGV